jgi:hypothetical protein
MAETRAQHLNRVMQGHEGTWQHRGERQFDHHDPIDGRSGQDHDRSKSGLHQPKANNAEPAQERLIHETRCG